MLTRSFPFLDPARIGPGLAPRLRALADDCDQFVRTGTISPSALQDAPFLNNWMAVTAQDGVRLVGYVKGHPLLGDRAVVTSSGWFADPNNTWARTLSRFYKLGRHANWETVHKANGGAPFGRPGNDDSSEDKA